MRQEASITDHVREAPEATVLHVLAWADWGEATRDCLDAIGALRRSGWRSVVACQGGELVYELQRAGATVETVPYGGDGFFARRRRRKRIAAIARAQGAQLLHAYDPWGAIAALGAARSTRLPVITTYPRRIPAENSRDQYEQEVLAAGARVIVLSAPMIEFIARAHGARRDAMRVIPPAVDASAWDLRRVGAERVVRLATQWRLPDGPPVVLLAGPLAKGPALDALFEAIAKIETDICAVVVDRTPPDDEVEATIDALIKRHKLEMRVRKTGMCRDMAAAFMLSDVVVATATKPEAAPRVIAEAQAMGRPVVTPSRAEIADLVILGETGLSVGPDKTGEVIAAIRDALTLDPTSRAAIAQRGISHARERFAREVVTTALIALYREAIAGA